MAESPFSSTLRVPADVDDDLAAVCGSRKRNEFIVAAIRARLDAEPAAKKKRAEREAAIQGKAGTGVPLTPAEAAQWWRKVEESPPAAEVTRYIVSVGGKAVIFGRDDLPAEYRHQFGIVPAGDDD